MSKCKLIEENKIKVTLNTNAVNGYINVSSIEKDEFCNDPKCDACNWASTELLDNSCIDGIEVGLHSYYLSIGNDEIEPRGCCIYLGLIEGV